MKQLHIKYAIVFACGFVIFLMTVMYGNIIHSSKVRSMVRNTLSYDQYGREEITEQGANIKAGSLEEIKPDARKLTLPSHSTNSRIEARSPISKDTTVAVKKDVEILDGDTIEKTQRIKHAKEACSKLSPNIRKNDVQNILKQHDSKKPRFYFSDKYNFMVCEIPKCGSTSWKKLLVAMEGETNLTNPAKMPGDVAHTLGSKRYLWNNFNANDPNSHSMLQKRIQNYTHVMTVREPLERLVSAYKDKMLPSGSGGETYLKVSRQIHAQYKENTNTSGDTEDKEQHASWIEFVRYLLDPNRKVRLDAHWDRFTDMCDPCSLTFDYIVKLETVADDVAYLSKKIGYDFTPFFPAAVEANRNKKWKTQYSEYFEFLTKEQRQGLYNMYAKQYEIFGYPKPEFL